MKNRVFLLSLALVSVLSVALNQQSNPIVSWFSPATTAEAQAASRTFGREGLDAVLFFFQEKGIKPYVDGVAIDDDAATTQKICELAGYSRVAYLKSRNFASCGDNFIEYWDGSSWIRSAACPRQPFIDTLTCDTPIVQSTQCNDGIDNDNDGKKDYPNDPGCSSAQDTSEGGQGDPQCNDGIDNDNDGFVDFSGGSVGSVYANAVFSSAGEQQLVATGVQGGNKITLGITGTVKINSVHTVDCGTGTPGSEWNNVYAIFTNDQNVEISRIKVTNQSTVTIPAGATKVFVAYVDQPGWYGDNSGSCQMTGVTVSNPNGDPQCTSATDDSEGIENAAICISSTVPSTVVQGQNFTGIIRIKNTGTKAWTGNKYYLGIPHPQLAAWSLTNAGAVWAGWPTAVIAPGQEVDIPVGGRGATVGTFPFDWRMVQDDVEIFGAVCAKNITVTPAVAAGVDLKINGQDGIVVIPRGSSVTVSWTSTGVARCDTSTSLAPWGPYVPKPVNGTEVFTPTQGLTVGIQCAETLTSNMTVQDSGSGIRFTRCTDGIDNDNDGLVDGNDGGCNGVNDDDEGGGFSSSSSSSSGFCSTAAFDASYGSLTNQGWTALNPGTNQSVQTLTENGVTFLRINDQSTTQGMRTEFTSITDSALADRDWNLEMRARIHNSTENGYVIGMNMLLTSPAGKYASIYIDTDKFGPIGTSINQYNYARTYNADTTNGFHTYAIRYKKNGSGVNDDTFDVLFDGQVVMSNVSRTEIWDSAQWNQNINGISFGVGSSPGQAMMDVQYVRFQNTDVYNCGSSSSSSSSTSTSGWQCSNGIDDDGDGQTDSNDPGCHTDKNRYNSMSYNPYGTESDNNRSYTCQDGVDNNTNGLVDSQDPICHWDGNPNNNASFTPNANEGFGGSSSSSSSSAGSAQCNNGYDDDGDALVDSNDPGCHTDRNRYNPASYNPNGTENGNDRNRGCQDGIDNNGNGLIDAQDPACHSDGNPNNPGSFDPNRNEDGGSQGNGCIIIKTRAEDEDGDRIDDDLPAFTVQLNNGLRSAFTDEDGDARFNNLSNGSYNVSMLMYGDWEIDSISPSNGNVTVSGSSCKTVTFDLIDNDDSNDDDDDDDNDDDAEVEVRKTASSSEVFPGGTIEYVITIENTGDVDLENLIVEDRVPSDLTIIDDGDADDRHSNELTWEIDIDEGDTETIRYRVAVPSYMYPGQTIRNDVRVTSDDNDIDIDEDASAFITVIGTLPQTGMMGMVSNASAYLTPIRQAATASSSSGMGTAAAAATTVLTGLGGGIALGRKYLGL